MRLGTAAADGKRIVLHADDFGMNRAVTDGIVRGFRHGLLTSTSLLANAPDASRALTQWKELAIAQQAGDVPSSPLRRKLGDPAQPFDLGIHLNLSEGRPLTASRYPPELLDQRGCFPGIFRLFRRLHGMGTALRQALADELAAQAQFLLDHGLQPTHLNGHQYIEMFPVIAEAVPGLLERFHIRMVRVGVEPSLWRTIFGRGLGMPAKVRAAAQQFYARRFCRRVDQFGIAHPDVFFGATLAGHIDMSRIRALLKYPFRLAEVCLHPAEAAPNDANDNADGWRDPLTVLRPDELRLLVSDELAEYLVERDIRLGRLGELRP
jgi:predicted glycoside hydrolase/deacetylase ChbG (UPF0249 family)